MNSGIYQIRNTINNHIYIGSAADFSKRKYDHFKSLQNQKHKNKYLQNAYNKYGEENFVFEVLEYCDKSETLIREQWYLDNWQPEYNLYKIAGSPLGTHLSQEAKDHLFKIFTGREISQEQKEKLSIANSGENNFWFGKFGDKHPRYGTKHTDETKEKISRNRVGKMLGILNHKSKPVFQIDLNTGEILARFESACLASKETGIPQSNITKVIHGERHHAGGYYWEFA